jgi:hypothetical protein
MKKGPFIHPNQTPEEKAKEARRMANKRWEGTTPEERSQHAAFMASQRVYVPPDPSKPRCPCSAMTLARAQARADLSGKGLGHKPTCTFYRRQRHPGKRK